MWVLVIKASYKHGDILKELQEGMKEEIKKHMIAYGFSNVDVRLWIFNTEELDKFKEFK